VRSGWLAGGKLADGIGGQVQEKAMQAIAAQIPMGALGDPADVAAAVTFSRRSGPLHHGGCAHR